MKKAILTATVLAFAATAQAESSATSSEGSRDILNGILGGSSVTVKSIVGSGESSQAKASASLESGSKKSVYVIYNPSEATSEGSKKAGRWVVDTSGNVYEASIDGSHAFSHEPGKTTSAAFQASGAKLDASGDASSQAGKNVSAASQKTYEQPMADLGNGSTKFYDVAEGSVVAIVEGSKTTFKFIDEHSVDSVVVSSEGMSDVLSTMSEGSKDTSENSFNAGKQKGRQYAN